MSALNVKLHAARQLAQEYGSTVLRLREELGMSLRRMHEVTGIHPSTISQIENGIRLPTDQEASMISLLATPWAPGDPELRELQLGWEQLSLRGVEVGETARLSDPSQSHDTVQSISQDSSMAKRILLLAREAWPEPFSDTDLVSGLRHRWPHIHWQRNVVAKCRLTLHTLVILDDSGNRTRVEDPHAPIIRAGTWAPAGASRQLDHFIWNREAHHDTAF